MWRGKPNISLKDYENRHNTVFTNNLIKVLYRIKNDIYFETEFGICKKFKGHFGICNFNYDSAINKNEYLKNLLFKKFGDKYNYSELKYNSKTKKITIKCKKHGEFEQLIHSHMAGKCCLKCAIEYKATKISLSFEKFIERVNIIHNFRYEYNLKSLKGVKEKIKISCKEHGEFLQTVSAHLNGQGCPKCGHLHIKEIRQQNPTGWSYSNWEKAAKNSKNFDSFKLYIIECWNENEKFYKIGRTFQKIEKRFPQKTALPYNYKIINIICSNNSIEIFNLENTLKKENKEYKYVPKIKFHGMYECFIKKPGEGLLKNLIINNLN